MALLKRILHRVAREQSGMGMFEVLMSALILAIISVGVLKTFDAAGATSGFNKSRATAADLATEDLERLRGFRPTQLTGLNQTRTRSVNGVDYTVVSTATWLSDDSGSRTCTSDGKQIEYVRLTSKVTWPNIKTAAQAVTQSTLYAPPKGSFGTQGAMAVQVLDRNGAGVAGVAVAATGPASLSGTTNGIGCVYFPYIGTGSYNVTISKSGYIDRTGSSTPSATVGVTQENVTTQSFDFDSAGSIAGTVKTRRSSSDVRTLTSGTVSLSHSQLANPRTVAVSGAGAYSFANVFPFTGSYYLSPGNCDGTQAGGTALTVAPASSNSPMDLYMPSAEVLLDGNPGYTGTNMVIKLTPTISTGGCTVKTYYGKAATSGNANTVWWLSPSSAADVPGSSYATADASVSYGTYDACISAYIQAYNTTVYWKSSAVALTDQAKVDTIPISQAPYSSSNRTGYGTTASSVGC